MSSSKVPFTITYRKSGIAPPLFVAGSFSDPQWQPQEMEYSTGEDGENTFRSEIMVEPGKDYQFKLRVGPGDWWVLSDDHAVVTDDSGNKNNVLNVPIPDAHESNGEAVINHAPIEESSNRVTPNIETSIPDIDIDDGKDATDDLKTPLFAHECLGAYEFQGDDESEEEACPSMPIKPDVKLRSNDYNTTNIDMNDPTLEEFPSDRTSILDALRTIQTHLSEDQAQLKDIPTSPGIVSGGRPSIDATDELGLSPVPFSPSSSKRREQRLSHSSFGRTRSAVSLGSIAEESKADDLDVDGSDIGEPSPGQISPGTREPQVPPVITLSNPNTAVAIEEPRSPPSEEDEAVAMKPAHAVTDEKPSIKVSSDPIDDDSTLYHSGQGSKNNTEDEVEKIEDSNPKHSVDESNTPLIPNKIDDFEKSHTILGSTEKVSVRAKFPETITRPDVVQRDTTVRKWLRGFLDRVRSNKLPIILTTGILAIAMGMRWWNGSKE